MKIAFQIDGGIGRHVSFSSITGESGNTIYNNIRSSARLGGAGNTLKHNCAAVFGVGITTLAANTLHVNRLNANSISAFGSYPAGTIYQTTIPSLPAPYNTYTFLGII